VPGSAAGGEKLRDTAGNNTPRSWRCCPTPPYPPATPPPPRHRPPPCSGEFPGHPRPSPCPRLGFPSPYPFNVEDDRGPSDCLKTNGLDGRIPLLVLWDADRRDPLASHCFFPHFPPGYADGPAWSPLLGPARFRSALFFLEIPFSFYLKSANSN
jgi:hypothetical protein